MTGNQIDVGDVLIDERTGERREVVSVLRVEDLAAISQRALPGSSAGYAAGFGFGSSRDRQERARQQARMSAPAQGTCSGAGGDR